MVCYDSRRFHDNTQRRWPPMSGNPTSMSTPGPSSWVHWYDRPWNNPPPTDDGTHTIVRLCCLRTSTVAQPRHSWSSVDNNTSRVLNQKLSCIACTYEYVIECENPCIAHVCLWEQNSMYLSSAPAAMTTGWATRATTVQQLMTTSRLRASAI